MTLLKAGVELEKTQCSKDSGDVSLKHSRSVGCLDPDSFSWVAREERLHHTQHRDSTASGAAVPTST